MEEGFRSCAFPLLILYSSFIVYGTLIPFDMVLDPALIQGRWEQVDLTLSCYPEDRTSLPNLVSDLFLFFPLGFLVYANLCLGPARAVPKVLVGLVLGSLLDLS